MKLTKCRTRSNEKIQRERMIQNAVGLLPLLAMLKEDAGRRCGEARAVSAQRTPRRPLALRAAETNAITSEAVNLASRQQVVNGERMLLLPFIFKLVPVVFYEG